MKQNNHQSVERSKEIAALVAAYRASGLGLRRFAQENRTVPSHKQQELTVFLRFAKDYRPSAGNTI